MFWHDSKNGSVYWDKKKITAEINSAATSINFPSDAPEGATITLNGKTWKKLGEWWMTISPDETNSDETNSEESSWQKWSTDINQAIEKFNKEMEKRAAQNNHNFKVLEERIKNLKKELCKTKEAQSKMHEDVVDVWRLAFSQKYQIKELQEVKIDRPSMSVELADAERYIDDLRTIQKKYDTDRLERKQRIRKKLEEIKEANRVSKQKETSGSLSWVWLFLLMISCLMGVLTIIGLAYL